MTTRESKKQSFMSSGYKVIMSAKHAYHLTRWAIKQKIKDTQRGIDPTFFMKTGELLLIKPGNLYKFYKLKSRNKKMLLICDLSAVEEINDKS